MAFPENLLQEHEELVFDLKPHWWFMVPAGAALGASIVLGLISLGANSAAKSLAGILILPWVVADPTAFVGDTVTTLLEFHPIRFANTWFLYALNEHGVTLPFAVTGAAMVGAVAVAAYAVWRRRPDVAELLRWLALVLAVANLVNKQAFYNQFWLVGALVAASLAVAPPEATAEPTGGSEPVRGVSGRVRGGAAATAG